MSPPTKITARIPEALYSKLNGAVRDSRRSRSAIIRDALERYLSGEPQCPAGKERTRDRLMSFAGAGIRISNRRTAEEIDAEIRWLRDD